MLMLEAFGLQWQKTTPVATPVRQEQETEALQNWTSEVWKIVAWFDEISAAWFQFLLQHIYILWS